MRSLIVVVVDAFVHYRLEVRAATNDLPVQAFASSTADPALGNSVSVATIAESGARRNSRQLLPHRRGEVGTPCFCIRFLIEVAETK